jgi:peptidoglycan/xylan/chitin deacetylase (PgdA/CDA1 family)
MLIVNYHAIEPQRSAISCTVEDLRADIRRLRDAGFTFLSLDQCAEWLAGARALPARAAALTFDDGYASVASRAVPYLAAQSVPCTVFVIAGRIGGDNRWPGQWPSIPTLPLVDRPALLDMAAAGVTVGAHTFTHPVLPALDDESARREIVDAAAAIEDAVSRPVHYFAYPYGFRSPRDIALARGRYRLALSAHPALIASGADPADVPRADCHDVRVALRLGLASGSGARPYFMLRRTFRQVRRALSPQA